MKQDVIFKESCSVLRSGLDTMQYIKNTGRAVYVDGQEVIPSQEEYPIKLVSGENISLKIDEDNNIIISSEGVAEDTSVFGDVIATVDCGGLKAGTSLNGKTVKEVLTMMLGIEEAPLPLIEYIMQNQIPSYKGYAGQPLVQVTYKNLEANAAFSEEGFYTSKNSNGEVTQAGYQITFEPNYDGQAQLFAIYSKAKIITAYQYSPVLNQWLNVGFDGTYWIESGADNKVINGEQVPYTIYSYNTELMGDAITATEYWRFEVEV